MRAALARSPASVAATHFSTLYSVRCGMVRAQQQRRALRRAESDILEKLNHRHIVDVKATHMWEQNKVLIIVEELLKGGELLDAAEEAITQHGFTITESFAARVSTPAHGHGL